MKLLMNVALGTVCMLAASVGLAQSGGVNAGMPVAPGTQGMGGTAGSTANGAATAATPGASLNPGVAGGSVSPGMSSGLRVGPATNTMRANGTDLNASPYPRAPSVAGRPAPTR
jgi:hypothetical protein